MDRGSNQSNEKKRIKNIFKKSILMMWTEKNHRQVKTPFS